MISSTNLALMESTAVVINSWSKLLKQAHNVSWPDTYSIFDIETTGFNREKDLVIEWGCCDVVDGEIVDNHGIVLNWLAADHLVPVDWTEEALIKVAARMSEQGKKCRVDAEVMREEGQEPGTALPIIYDWLKDRIDANTIFVTHNGWNFDYPMIASHMQDFMEESITISPNGMLDTGMIEKASQLLDYPEADFSKIQTIEDYCRYVNSIRAKGVYWSLDKHCISKYALDQKYGVSVAECHNAAYDAKLVHLLMQEYKQILDEYELDEESVNDSSNTTVGPVKRRRGQKNS